MFLLRIIHKIEKGIYYSTVPPEMPTQGFVTRQEMKVQVNAVDSYLTGPSFHPLGQAARGTWPFFI